MKLLLFAGAGSSIELGVPGMFGLGEEFLDHASQWDVEPALVKNLIGESLDVEVLIDSLDKVCTARSTLEAMGSDTAELDRADKIRAEVEWFVQHAAERVLARDARLVWGPVLREAASVDLTIVTTNYDRAIELAANAERVSLEDGFGAFGNGEVANWVGFGDVSSPRLVKLHGSTDWYAIGSDGDPTKLRHPMPLFGRASLRLASGLELGSALVLPSREKLLNHSPYPRLSQTFLNAADSCDLAVFVGSSLRDHHIRDAAAEVARRVPLFLVGPTGDYRGIEEATPIRQCASHFLVSSLPFALRTREPAITLEAIAGQETGRQGVLAPLTMALDGDAPVQLRCDALEDLDRRGVSLDAATVRRLLADSEVPVARYALGLLAHSDHAARLLEEAEGGPHASVAAFAEDLGMLRQLIGAGAAV